MESRYPKKQNIYSFGKNHFLEHAKLGRNVGENIIQILAYGNGAVCLSLPLIFSLDGNYCLSFSITLLGGKQ